ncbi:hypothetical protein N9Q00_00410 [Amylibacter sp.]|nr:hypothetical protein [Amylibacter sp.]MDB9785463.1 hypothetical protein [Amylibacter sp.]
MSILAAWAVIKNKIGLIDFGQLLYLIGILEFICTLGLFGFDSFAHRFAQHINRSVLWAFQKVQIVFSVVVIFIALFTNIYLDLNYQMLHFAVFLIFIISTQSFLISNALLVAKARPLRSVAMQITKSLSFLIIVCILPNSLMVSQFLIIGVLSICILIPSLLFRLSGDNICTLPDLKTKFKNYAPQFYLSSLVGIGYLVIFRTVLQNQLDAELFGYFMFILMIFAQINGLWTSAFKALLPSVFNQAQDEVWANKLHKICIYLSFSPFVGVFLAQALPAITPLLGIQRYPHDAELLIILVMSFASSGMVSLLSTLYYKNTKGLRLFFVSLVSGACTLIFMYLVSGMEDKYLYGSLCVGSQWILNYLSHVIGYRKNGYFKPTLPIIILGINTVLCMIII